MKPHKIREADGNHPPFPPLAAPSFNGRTADSGSAYRGSNPWGAANLESTAYDLRIPPKQPTGEQKSVTFVSGTRRNRDDSAGHRGDSFLHWCSGHSG